jgi:hypothetical protein
MWALLSAFQQPATDNWQLEAQINAGLEGTRILVPKIRVNLR